MAVKVRKYYGDIEICATCGTGQLTRLRDGMIRKHKREVWENGQWTGSHEHCPGSGQPHIDLVAANNARAAKTDPQEPTVTTDFKPGQRIVVADGSVHTVVKMARWANEPVRVEVEGGLQWLASECELIVGCSSHRVSDERGEFVDELPVPACQPGVTYGIWNENDGGFAHTRDCALRAANDAAEFLAEDPDGEYKVLAVCREHEEQPADTCEDCFAEGDEN